MIERLPDPVAAARRLPQGSLVIVRARDADTRADWRWRTAPVARDARLDPPDRRRSRPGATVGANGFICRKRGPARRRIGGRSARLADHRRGPFLARGLRIAHADAVLLSPVFATASHPKAQPL